MVYLEYDIAEALKPFVKVIWSMESDSPMLDGTPMHILPDTCVELVVHFRDPYKTTYSDNTVSIQHQSMVVAQMKSFIRIQSCGKTGIIAVRFSALGAYHFFGIPMNEISNREVSLRNLWPGIAGEIEERVNLAETTDRRAQIIQKYLRLQLAKNGYVDKTVDFCVKEIKRAKGQLSISALTEKAGISSRQLVRRFDKCIGLSPKEFVRITKFIGALDMINNTKGESLTEIALTSGYYDQAHFIHDFRKFSGMNPTEYLSSSNVVY
ncbi:MAG TPA: helix-turn-helix domain-containing protein [Chryseolinea sp.]